eukprot:CAMPEP_0203860296 /NCGR_PEP_ID=MMETSP0359-20131031/12343_1 /ASSEMBLY_ACC=CAM_ASM_000338 /TAXON_ID=268821 /ORGANISM="Scrippsiella Hangoei, Strain SHTV-5" /LENGTH=77 /DNA_ID=CAMNT_0050777343 /DNA_START=341 /DNA_END=572 /DNA_ORIENTATION=+
MSNHFDSSPEKPAAAQPPTTVTICAKAARCSRQLSNDPQLPTKLKDSLKSKGVADGVSITENDQHAAMSQLLDMGFE